MQSQIVQLVRNGVFVTVAVRACGVGKSTLFDRLSRGATERRGKYREFAEAIDQARAQARASAELEVRRTNPLAWLRQGAGRSVPGEPGWTEPSARTTRAEVELAIRNIADDLKMEPAQLAAIAEAVVTQYLERADRDIEQL